MSAHGEQILCEKLIEQSAGLAETQQEARFIRHFYSAVPPRDLIERDPEDLREAVRHMLETGHMRQPGTPKIAVGNPLRKGARHGAAHTVIEVINDDMPFLVDSVTGELNRQGLTVHLVIHPIVRARRNADGALQKILEPGETATDAVTESWMRIEVDLHTANAVLSAIQKGLASVLADVRAAVRDWPQMLQRARDAVTQLTVSPPALEPEDIEEGRDFLNWLADDHFTFLGYREYRISGGGDDARMDVVPDSGLGILRDPDDHVFEGVHEMAKLPPDVRDFLERRQLLVVNKTNARATVHRTTHMDAIGVKLFDEGGRVVGERLYVGLFTSIVYTRSPMNIPLLRLKIARAMGMAKFPANSHDGKALQHIFQSYPRDELFQISVDDLYRIGMGILHLQERQRIALFARHDNFQRFVSCMVYVPRERYTTEMRQRFSAILEHDFKGPVTAYYIQLGDDSVLARIMFIIKTDPAEPVHRDVAATEAKLVEAGRSWTDKLRDALAEAEGEEKGLRLLHRYADAFPAGYRDSMRAENAVEDIAHIEAAHETGRMQLNFHCPDGTAPGVAGDGTRYQFRMYNPGLPMPLSDVLPVLENMGLRVVEEVPHRVDVPNRPELWIHDFGVVLDHPAAIEPMSVRDAFHEAFERTWTGEMQSDGFNALVLTAGLTWREIVVLRAYAKYLRQIGAPFSPEYIQETFRLNPRLARLVVDLFLDRFCENGARAEPISASIAERLEQVSSLDQDRIVRWFTNLVRSTLRTNFMQTDDAGNPKPYLSLKLNSQGIDDLPLPRPTVEIWVYSPRFEGVHLRFGKVARGGLRWSDRREDFRTEILGLVKAQVVKNAVIVPVGSKGGFVLKQPPADGGREALQQEGIACYKMFVAGMLDLTDNIVEGEVVPPKDVVRYDDDDPYLVVAADKGTATFSDIANGVSEDYGFWLRDAFASGGSAGYDHKEMGITARGAWEAVKRHFREMGHDTQSQDFTVVGIGDMSGDVFGNGMLLSEHIRLVAAFNHLHIFVDPDPDPAHGFRERKRLFEQPRSSWADYDPAAISTGGGVFERKAKSIPVSREMQAALDIDKDRVTPNELIRHILTAQVDLLWFGGIGTYVKAGGESDVEVGDRANDAIRVRGRDLRARVVGEGANLGMTQLGRIEYAQHGGRLNTDAIDNSGGVDCSDHEVNIKILLRPAMERGDLSMAERNALLESMTDEVADLVLRDNYLQTATISVTESLGRKGIDRLVRFMRDLERAGLLNRTVEFLPNEDELEARASAGTALTRPELSVLLAYAKIELFDKLLASGLPDDPYFVADLRRYFPEPLREPYAEDIEAHRLRREIIATYATNSTINRAGITFAHDMEVETGMPAADVVRAYVIVRDAFDLRALWAEIEALDNRVDATAQVHALLQTGRLLKRAVEWFMRHADRPLDIARTVEAFRPNLHDYFEALGAMLPERALESMEERKRKRMDLGMPEALARRLALQPLMLPGCNIVQLVRETGQPLEQIGTLFFAVGERFALPWLRDVAYDSAPDEYWDKLAAYAIIDDFYTHQYELTRRILGMNGRPSLDDLDTWISERQPLVGMFDRIVEEMRGSGSVDIAMLAVSNRHMRTLLGA